MSDWPPCGDNIRDLPVIPSGDYNAPEPFDLPIDDFLAGREGRELDIDPIFGQPLGEILRNYDLDALQCGPDIPAVSDRIYKLRKVDTGTDHGIVLVSPPNEVVGAYIGGALAIAPQHQGRGLGAELVFEFACAFGTLPTWFMDIPAYSPAGVAAHRRAWHLARNAEFMKAKTDLGFVPIT
jgi:GNAT superfamily N-acetyltransferase